MPLLKICGINDAAFAVEAAKCGANYLGFIFAEGSPRCVTPEKARAIIAAVNAALRRGKTAATPPHFVGVFTSRDIGAIADTAKAADVDIVQLHGDYGATEVAALKTLGYEVWRLAPPFDGDFAGEDAVLLDGRKGAQRGGTGRLADWSRVAPLKRLGRRVVLAGGISAANVAAASATGADILDANSALETSPGVKSQELLRELVAALCVHRSYAHPAQGGASSPSEPK